MASSLKRLPVVVDCHSGDHCVVTAFPFSVGASGSCNWHITDEGLSGRLFLLQAEGGNCVLCPEVGGELFFDGCEAVGPVVVSTGEDHTISTGGQFFLLRLTSSPKDWINHINPHQWYIHHLDTGEGSGPYEWGELPGLLRASRATCEVMAHPSGMMIGFFAWQILAADRSPTPVESFSMLSPAQSLQELSMHANHPEGDAAVINAEHGAFTCPVCWLKFDRGDVMNIAIHASLRGDQILGEEAMQRFHATRFNDMGQALDAMNLPTSDQACPHCRRKLPPGFLDTPHHIFSIVGAPSSGKSYYLSVLVRQLQHVLFKEFNVIFRDADPSENVILTQMKTSLFSAGSPQDAFLAKTDLEGALYETLPRYGRKARLPKPFIFRLSSGEDPGREASIVFYDNAGEHFEPTRNSADSPGAQHIAVASGIFFLFDPLHSIEFRSRLNGTRDPQLASKRMDQQDVILAETEVRIKSLLGLDTRQRVSTPLAFMVGKCDTWLQMVGGDPLLPVVVGGHLHRGNVDANSARLRSMLMEIAPAVVANAEAISSNVRYFAISPLGASPVEFIDDHDGSTKIGPDPKHLNPQFVEVPTLWVLSQLMNDLIPSQGE